MVNRIYVIKTSETNPWHNLALEETLLNKVRPDECVLYLWQNRQTVVIGRNQNALSECRIQKLEADGGFLARRLSGGGAVYHDIGNLNFTFLAGSDSFDKEKQTDVILKAVRMAGINAEKNGRNDLTVDGRKFSGHAYYKTKGQCYHHGTLMLYVDKTKLSDYLNVSPLKLKSKGVASVKSRVINLCELNPKLTVEALSENLIKAFGEVYGLPVEYLKEDIDTEEVSRLEEKYSSPEWKYAGQEILPFSIEKRFDWGQARFDFEKEENRFSKNQFYSDGLEADYLSEISERLAGCEMKSDEILSRLTKDTNEDLIPIAKDIAFMISEKTAEEN